MRLNLNEEFPYSGMACGNNSRDLAATTPIT